MRLNDYANYSWELYDRFELLSIIGAQRYFKQQK